MRRTRTLPTFAAALVIVALAAAVLLAAGRPPICTCGYVDLWHGRVDSGNSQHLLDWYSPSHLIHGLLFYGAGWLVLRARRKKMPVCVERSRDTMLVARGTSLDFARDERNFVSVHLLAAITIEAGWEIVENSPMVIDRYRTAMIALGYTGDSVLNSLADIGCMAIGFWLARTLPVRTTVALAIGFELLTLWVIRDNLTLNVLMLLWPIEAVRQWQAGGGS